MHRNVAPIEYLSRFGLCALAAASIWQSSSVRADSSVGYDHCKQILEGGVFNIMEKRTDNISEAQARFYVETFFSDEQSAYESYERAYEHARQNNTTISNDLSFSYFFGIDDDFALQLGSAEKMSEQAFAKSWNEAKTRWQQTAGSESSSSKKYSEVATSQIADAAIVDAWRACVSGSPEQDIYVFASRDNSDRIYVGAIWAPGKNGAGVFPSATVEFVDDGNAGGAHVKAPQVDTIAVGSGKTYAVSCQADACDRGFRIFVNAETTAAGQTLSFTGSAEVPAKESPIDCTRDASYPLGRWQVAVSNATPAEYNKSIQFTTETSGSWLPSSGTGTFDVSATPSPKREVILTYQVTGSTYTSQNHLVVSPDGCHMSGTFGDVEGHRGEVIYSYRGL